jgi:hypothetical protein
VTTALDRLLLSINDDGPIPWESQLELVADVLARRVTLRRVTPLCGRCGSTLDADLFCASCGAINGTQL